MPRLPPASWDLPRLMAPLRRNVLAKLFAGLCAFILWLFVNAGKRETQVVQFPVELRNAPEQSMIVNDRIDTVAVRLNGPGALLASLDGRRAPIVLDLGNVEPGHEVRFKVRDEMIRVPRGVRILDIDPERIPVRLEQIQRATVPVRVAHTGDPPAGYHLDSLKAMPSTVVVTGPSSALAALPAIETEPIDVSGLTAPAQRMVALVRGEQLRSVAPERVTVQIGIEEATATREFKRVPVEVRNVDRAFQLRPAHVKLTVRGPERAAQGLEIGAGDVFVDGGALGVGEHTVEPEIVLPAGLTVVSREPATLNLEIFERKGARR